MRPISTMALAISSVFAVLGGTAYAESTMTSGDLIKEMHPSVDAASEDRLQEGRSAAGGEGPDIGDAAEEDSSGAREEGTFMRQAPAESLDTY